jgi:hypothetical protein
MVSNHSIKIPLHESNAIGCQSLDSLAIISQSKKIKLQVKKKGISSILCEST